MTSETTRLCFCSSEAVGGWDTSFLQRRLPFKGRGGLSRTGGGTENTEGVVTVRVKTLFSPSTASDPRVLSCGLSAFFWLWLSNMNLQSSSIVYRQEPFFLLTPFFLWKAFFPDPPGSLWTADCQAQHRLLLLGRQFSFSEKTQTTVELFG